MLDVFGKWKTKIEAFAMFIVLLTLAVLIVPTLKNDPDKPKLINLDTKELTSQKIVSESFIFAVFIAGLIPLLYIAWKSEETSVPKRRSIVEVWKDIKEPELIKLGLSHILDKKFTDDTILYTQDDTYSILRYPAYNIGKFYYLVLDMKDDWAKRATTPIYSFATVSMGVDRAKSLLGKKGEPLGKFIQEAEKVGLSKEEIRNKMVQRQLEIDRARQNAPVGDVNETNI